MEGQQSAEGDEGQQKVEVGDVDNEGLINKYLFIERILNSNTDSPKHFTQTTV